MEKVLLYDTTLRDGAQTAGIAFSVNDKIRIVKHLDALGMDYIEGGWPSPANARDLEFFHAMRDIPLSHAKFAAFGSTCRAGVVASEDAQLLQLVAFGVPVVTIFGKTWDLHVTEALRIPLEENIRMIEDSVAFLVSTGVEVIYDAEHYFDGYLANPAYALETLRAAARGGAQCIVLCDTNGGRLPTEVREMLRLAQQTVSVPIGMHAHNDGELAVANTLVAIEDGVRHIQGTMNGYGERCGNANLCSIIPTLELKMGYAALPEGKLQHLYEAAHFVAEIANVHAPEQSAYVGSSAFAHKGGVHIDSIMKVKRSYEHITPELVGNHTHLLVSDQAGGSTVVDATRKMGIELEKKSPAARAILERMKDAENAGYSFEAAEASFEMLIRRELGLFVPEFEVIDFRVLVGEHVWGPGKCDAVVRVRIGEEEELMVADGDGPVHALDSALRKAIEPHFPKLREIHLTDFKVRIVNDRAGTAARVRVLVESSDGTGNIWNTVGVHENLIVASLEALTDALHYGIARG